MRSKIIRKSHYFVYVVRCKHGTLYAGYTNDLDKRLKMHNSNKGAKYLRGKGPVELVYSKEYKYYKNAVKAEARIKRLSKREKERLIYDFPKITNTIKGA